MDKLLSKPNQSAIIQYYNLQFQYSPRFQTQTGVATTTIESKDHPDITALLQELFDFFEEPKGLPLCRAQDHKIPLKEHNPSTSGPTNTQHCKNM